MSKTPYSVTPLPGYILCKPHIHEGMVLLAKETEGMDQRSVVIVSGPSITDSAGIVRESTVKEGDIIIHAQTNKEFEFQFDKYRFVHFTEVHGVLKILNTK